MKLAARDDTVAAGLPGSGQQPCVDVWAKGNDLASGGKCRPHDLNQFANFESWRREIDQHEPRRLFGKLHFGCGGPHRGAQFDGHAARGAAHLRDASQVGTNK